MSRRTGSPIGQVAVTALVAVIASLTMVKPAPAQARASLQATARVVDAGAGWLAHAGVQAELTKLSQKGIPSGKMTVSLPASGEAPQPLVRVVRTAGQEPGERPEGTRAEAMVARDRAPARLLIYVEHVAN